MGHKLHRVVESFYLKLDGACRSSLGLGRMLRMYVAQQCFGLSDEDIEDAIYYSRSIRALSASTWATINREERLIISPFEQLALELC